MSDKKVFCKKCEHIHHLSLVGVFGTPYEPNDSDVDCDYPDNLKDTSDWYNSRQRNILKPSEINKDNDCLWFSPKTTKTKQPIPFKQMTRIDGLKVFLGLEKRVIHP